jgi:hypothetical protein
MVGRHEGKTSHGKPRNKLENNVKIDLRKMGYEVENGFDSIWVGVCMLLCTW